MVAFETAPPDLKPLLGERISGLGLKLKGSPMEHYVAELYRELEATGLSSTSVAASVPAGMARRRRSLVSTMRSFVPCARRPSRMRARRAVGQS